MNQKEKKLFLQLCAFQNPNVDKLEALLNEGAGTSNVLGMLFSNRMAGVAYGVLEKANLLDKVDREFRNSLKNAALYNEKINEDFLGCVRYVTAELEGCNVPYALLKGAYLCNWYPKGYRTSNDIDVLISSDDVGKVSTKLKLAGFKQGYLKNGQFIPATRQQIIESKMMRGETVPFIKETKLPFLKYLEVDLNFSLDYKNGDDSLLKEMLSRNRVVDISDAKIRTLSEHDFMLHLCAHLYKEATTIPWIKMKRDMTFYKYCDIYALLQDYSIEKLNELIEEACSVGLECELAYCLNSIEKFFGSSAVKCRKYIHNRNNDDLDIVFAPTEKKKYRYIKTNPVDRFFTNDRIKLLIEDI